MVWTIWKLRDEIVKRFVNLKIAPPKAAAASEKRLDTQPSAALKYET
jgi:hypothetical protein